MEKVIAYKCQCGEICEDKEDITTCSECGKEICIECCGFEEDLCWECNNKKLKEEENKK